MDEICIISSRDLYNILWVALSAYKRQLGDPIGCCQRLARKEKDKCLVNRPSHACVEKTTLKRDDDDDDSEAYSSSPYAN